MTVRGFFSKRYKYRILTVLLAACILFAVGCSFINPTVTTAPVEDDSPDPPSSSTTTTEPDDTPDAPDDSDSPVQVLTNEGDLEVRPVYIPTDPFTYRLFQYDDTHYLCLTYDQTELAGYKEYAYDNLHVYIIDAKAGTVVADCAIEGSYYLSSVHYTDNGCILYETEEAAFHVVYENGTLTVNKTEHPTYPVVSDCPITSADGAYTVYTTAEDTIGAGTMTVRYADGSTKALLRHKNAGDMVDGQTVGMGDVERYHPIGFLDNTRFVYSIAGYEYYKGYGVYDLQTGANTKHLQAMSVAAVYDGKVYLTKQAGYETVSWWMCDPDGLDMTMIASVNEEDGVFTLSGDKYNYTYNFKNGVWFFFTEDDTITLYSHDFGQRLAKLEYADSGHLFGNMQVHQNILTVVVPYVEEEPAQSPVRVLSNEGNLNVHAVALPLPTEKSVYTAFTYNDRYMLYLVYDLLKNADGEEYCETVCLYAVDLLQGEFVSRHPLHTQYLPDWISYTKDGCILSDRKYGSDPSVNVAFSITEKNGVFTVQEVEIQGYPYMAYRFVSPDGQHVAYEMVENTWIHRGGVEIEYPDGSVKRITENVPGDWIEDDLSTDNPRFYSPVGFMDDTHIVYNILYVGSNKGYGIYDIVNYVVTEVNTIYSAISVYNGALYVAEYVYIPEEYRSARQAFWKVAADGRKTMVASFDADANAFTLPENAQIYFDDSVWKLREGDAAEDSIKTVLYSPDFDVQLAEIEAPNGNVHVYDNSVTVVMPYVETPIE